MSINNTSGLGGNASGNILTTNLLTLQPNTPTTTVNATQGTLTGGPYYYAYTISDALGTEGLLSNPIGPLTVPANQFLQINASSYTGTSVSNFYRGITPGVYTQKAQIAGATLNDNGSVVWTNSSGPTSGIPIAARISAGAGVLGSGIVSTILPLTAPSNTTMPHIGIGGPFDGTSVGFYNGTKSNSAGVTPTTTAIAINLPPNFPSTGLVFDVRRNNVQRWQMDYWGGIYHPYQIPSASSSVVNPHKINTTLTTYTGTGGWTIFEADVIDTGTSTGAKTIAYLSATHATTGTMGWNGLQINVTDTGNGTGTKNLLDLQFGSVSKFTINNLGQISGNVNVISTANQVILGSTANTGIINSPTSLTAVRTLTVPDASGTIITTGNTSALSGITLGQLATISHGSAIVSPLSATGVATAPTATSTVTVKLGGFFGTQLNTITATPTVAASSVASGANPLDTSGATTYRYAVAPIDAQGNEGAVSPLSAGIVPSPANPSVLVSWVTVSGSLVYAIYRTTSAAPANYPIRMTSSGSSFTDTGSNTNIAAYNASVAGAPYTPIAYTGNPAVGPLSNRQGSIGVAVGNFIGGGAASTKYGLFSIGGPFDGANAVPSYGAFNSTASVALAINQSSSAIMFNDFQVQGVSKYSVSGAGNVIAAGTITGTTLSGSLAAANVTGTIAPSLLALQGWSMDTATEPTGSLSYTAVQQLRMNKCAVNPGSTLQKITVNVKTAGSGLNGLYFAIYDTSGNYLGATGDITVGGTVTALTTGTQTYSLSSSIVLGSTISTVYVALFINAYTTAPGLAASASVLLNTGLTATTYRAALLSATGNTTPPTSQLTMGNQVAAGTLAQIILS